MCFQYYGNRTAAKATVDHILSYMRSIPSWAYNGGARAADSGNNGKFMAAQGTGKPDRGQMHYRSGLNMIPLLEWYRGGRPTSVAAFQSQLLFHARCLTFVCCCSQP